MPLVPEHHLYQAVVSRPPPPPTAVQLLPGAGVSVPTGGCVRPPAATRFAAEPVALADLEPVVCAGLAVAVSAAATPITLVLRAVRVEGLEPGRYRVEGLEPGRYRVEDLDDVPRPDGVPRRPAGQTAADGAAATLLICGDVARASARYGQLLAVAGWTAYAAWLAVHQQGLAARLDERPASAPLDRDGPDHLCTLLIGGPA